MLTVGSLFTGIGGFDLGLERAGLQVLWQCELDKAARAVLQRHWPALPCHGDIRSLETESLPKVDVIAFGSPCQDLSIAGGRASLRGPDTD